MRVSIIILFVLVYKIGLSQNYILNPSFEDRTNCATQLDQLKFAPPWESPSQGTPDLFNECNTIGTVGVPLNFMGNLFAKEGQAYAGLHFVYDFNYREYLKTELRSCLKAGETYELSFWVSLSEKKGSPISTSFFQAHISSENTHFNQSSVLNLIEPNINFNENFLLNTPNRWEKLTASFTADGDEKYLIIGNFHPNSDIPVSSGKIGTYVFIDELKLVNPNPHIINDCGNSICQGDSMLIELYGYGNGIINWIDELGNSLGHDSLLWLSPDQSTMIYFEFDGALLDSLQITVFPNPKSYADVNVACDIYPTKVFLNSPINFSEIVWSNGTKDKLNIETTEGTGWVFVKDENSCQDTLDFYSDSCFYLICSGSEFSYTSPYSGDNLVWIYETEIDSIISQGSNTLYFIPEKSGIYYLYDGKYKIDSVSILVIEKREIELDINCHINGKKVRVKNPFGKPLWSDGSTNSYSANLNDGQHFIQLTDQFGCTSTKNFSLPRNCDFQELCFGDSLLLKNPRNTAGHWIDKINRDTFFVENQKLIIPNSGSYHYFFYNGEGEILDSIKLLVFDNYKFEFLKECINGKKFFEILNPFGDILWDNGREKSNREYLSQTNTWVQTTSPEGCVFKYDLIDERLCNEKIPLGDLFIPNVITPNNDGKNDYFIIEGEFTNMRLEIFNRWGKKVYEAYPYFQNWNAENLPVGDYFYQLKGEEIEGTIKGIIKVLH